MGVMYIVQSIILYRVLQRNRTDRIYIQRVILRNRLKNTILRTDRSETCKTGWRSMLDVAVLSLNSEGQQAGNSSAQLDFELCWAGHNPWLIRHSPLTPTPTP